MAGDGCPIALRWGSMMCYNT